uniref:NADH:ubiquinone oxidoreductase subunit S6 n=1 Tax=Eptatretus burgeri TaxID=7764 RepID=A0A8C4QVJ2_EPTBU
MVPFVIAVIVFKWQTVYGLSLQAYDENDYRRLRFVGRVKEVNEQFAINLVAEEPVQEVEGRTTWCDGGNGGLGHPRVYINLDKNENAVCGYCGLRFRQKHQHH